MNIYRINLNLLKVFVVLMREQHVSTAAKSLHLTQPAISNSLNQLRELFKDELFIRGTKKMVPTRKAIFLAPQIEKALCELENLVFYTDEFKYQTSKRTFNLGMSDYAEYVLLPKIYECLNKIAPDLSLRIKIYHEFCPENFTEEKLDLGIGLERKFPKQLISERLFNDNSVCVAHIKHPIFNRPLSLKTYVQAEHLATCVYSNELSRTDSALKKFNVHRNVKITLPNVLPAFQILATSNLIGTFSKRIVEQIEKKYHLKCVPLPFETPEFYISQIWHQQDNNDAGLIWLRQIIKNICVKYFY